MLYQNNQNIVRSDPAIGIPGYAAAHASHESFEPITVQQASTKAEQVLQSLIANKKLGVSWANAKRSTPTIQDTRYGKVWVVSCQNLDEKYEGKNTLYVFVDEMGNPITVNHEGKL